VSVCKQWQWRRAAVALVKKFTRGLAPLKISPADFGEMLIQVEKDSTR